MLDLYKKTGAWLNPTLDISGMATGEAMETYEAFASDERVASRIPVEHLALLRKEIKMAAPGAKWEYAIDSVRQLKAIGIDIIA